MPHIAEAVRELHAPDEDAARYLDYHRRRYEFLLLRVEQILGAQVSAGGSAPRILDIGMSHQTLLLQRVFPNTRLATMGFLDHRFPVGPLHEHILYNLNHAEDRGTWPPVEPYDLIVMAEVIEHLHVPPNHVLRMLRQMLRPGGGLLLQTPNPISLARRLSLLAGRSPFEIIRDDPTNPGHYCEYTLDQLQYLADAAGFTVTNFWLDNYFGRMNWKKRLYAAACALLPGELEEGITMELRRPFHD